MMAFPVSDTLKRTDHPTDALGQHVFTDPGGFSRLFQSRANRPAANWRSPSTARFC